MIVIESGVKNFWFIGESSLEGSSPIFAKRLAKGTLKNPGRDGVRNYWTRNFVITVHIGINLMLSHPK